MRFPAGFARKVYPFLLLLTLISTVLFWHFSPRAKSARFSEKSSEIANYDIRANETFESREAIKKFVSESGKNDSLIADDRKNILRAEKNLLSGAKLKIEHNENLQIPEIIAPDFSQNTNFVTAPSNEKRDAILRNFLRQNSELFGLDDSQIAALETTADYTNPDGNLSFVHFAQKIGDVPVFQGEVKAAFTKRDEIVRVINNLAPNLDDESISEDFGSAEFAIRSAAKHIGFQANEADMKRIAATQNDLKITFERGQFADITTAEKFYFPVDVGVALPAWRVLLWIRSDAFYVIVDAREGTLLWRKNITEYQSRTATFGVYGNLTSMMKTGDSPTPFTPGCTNPANCPPPMIIDRQLFTLVGNEPPYTFNNLGWIPDNGLPVRTPPDDNATDGNAVEAGIDRDGTQGVDAPVRGNPTRVFNFTYNPAPGNPPPGDDPMLPEFQKGSVTHAFYTVNRWHDEMYLLGFNEQAGNFQHFNFGRGGLEGDRVSAEIQDSSGTNSSSMSTPADGGRPRLQMYIWTGTTPNRDGALDTQMVVHELSHGISSRLHGNTTGLGSNMARGMGEGWSDFYALSLLSDPSDDLNGLYTVGCYNIFLTGGSQSICFYGIRRFPTARISVLGPNGRPYNPLTFRYLNSNCDTLIGTTSTNPNSAYPRNPVISTSSATQPCDQIHNMSEIWLQALWEVRGFLIAAHGTAEGNRRALQYVTDGMKLSPINPNMLQSRDAIIAAASASDPNDVLPVRRGYAARGMGFYASIQNAGTGNNNTQVTESFDVSGNVGITAGFAVSDAPGNNNGYPEQGETLRLTIPLTNTTGAPITGVTLQIAGGASAFYGDIANGQTVSQNINYTVPANAPCPGNYTITFNINSSVGMRTETRDIFLGVPFPGSEPVTFTNSTPLAIPAVGASTPYGTTINVSGLNPSSRKIKLEITGLTHTFPGDLDILLVGPGGQKLIVMSDAVNSFSTQTNANVVLKDAAASLLPTTASVNMNGEWKPTDYTSGDTFPAPAPAEPYQSPQSVGMATFTSVFGASGTGLNGTWTLYVVDDTNGDSGSIAGWKLTFEPNDYFCTVCLGLCPLPHTKGDFDGDGRTDVSVFRPSEGNWYLNQTVAGFGVVNWGLNGDLPAPGDFDGDGKTDFAIFRPQADASQPDFYVLNSNGFTYSGFSWGLPGDVPVIEDYDGDGKSDITIFRSSNHTFYVLRSSNGSVLTYSNILSGTPAAGDFDGDGKGDFATYSVNGWFLAQSNINYATLTFTRWGADGDKPVPADYDGDGKDDFAVFRPSDRTWYIRQSSAGNLFVQFGLSDDIPVPGDYDGDGRADIAVYRGGTWYINRSTSGILITQFGLNSDVPIPNRYLP
jgi:subtilisin-like proprotein convertase family protein